MKLSCKHRYCSSCLRQMTTIAMADEQRFPPKCCTAKIPLKTLMPTLTKAEKVLFLTKTQEFQTPPEERWYCPAKKCGKWISPSRLGHNQRVQICPHCRTRICRGCRRQHHPRRDCRDDPDFEKVLKLARNQRWQRCYGCRAVVERTYGCLHISCRCGTEFWYVFYSSV